MSRIRKGVITAAGRGTRQYPASQTVQKELFPLVDVDGYAKPTLQLIVEELLRSGLEEVCIVANPDNLDPIRRHFRGLTERERAGQFAGKAWAGPLSDALADMATRLTFVVQETQEGYGHAVYQARQWVGDEPFLLSLGDHVYFSDTDAPCARQVIDAYETHGAAVTSVTYALEADLHRYGTLGGQLIADTHPAVYKITELAEKPSAEFARARLRAEGLPDGQYLVHFGFHAFGPSIFACLGELIQRDQRHKGEIQLTAAQQLLLERERYLACEVAGVRYDMGIPEGLIETQIALALRSPFAAQARAMLTHP